MSSLTAESNWQQEKYYPKLLRHCGKAYKLSLCLHHILSSLWSVSWCCQYNSFSCCRSLWSLVPESRWLVQECGVRNLCLCFVPLKLCDLPADGNSVTWVGKS
jgi:hypothetical protein